nr:MAG TPA: cysteine-rich protein [Caudoviricetes sp.]DAH64112.1 MAG TPA: cysteine-rich protein [Caudoviricetes sp.]DAZ08353.1 MAG TPA: cysteine-rich protein [Caudoviricetes sp.]
MGTIIPYEYSKMGVRINRKGENMVKDGWVYCPICNNKTRTKIRKDTEAKNLPVFCPKCRNTTVMDIYGSEIKRMQSIK